MLMGDRKAALGFDLRSHQAGRAADRDMVFGGILLSSLGISWLRSDYSTTAPAAPRCKSASICSRVPPPKRGAVDLQVFHDPLHIVAGLRKRDLLDPINGIDLGIAGIAVTLDPFLDAAASGIIGGEGHDVGAAVILDQPRRVSAAPSAVL